MQAPIKNFKSALYSKGDVNQYYAENPALYAHLGLSGHNGTDIVRPWGEHLFACADGIICDLKSSSDGYGMHIRILQNAGNGLYREWTYGHMSSIAVKLGQKVFEGQYVGNIGNTGFVVSGDNANGYWKSNPYHGTHLHLGVRELKEKKDGWVYPGSNLMVEVLNYDNGYKGSIDPLPLLGVKQESFTFDLFFGMTGEAVSRLQVFLITQKLLETGVFGFFGPKTFTAVKAFQTLHNIPNTGYVGRLTREKINNMIKTYV